MFCHKCGSPNPDNAIACAVCGAAFHNPYQTPSSVTPLGTPPINNYLVPAILATVCCCLPFGIVSIVYAAQVNGFLAGGNVAGAQRAADNAKMWFWISLGMGLLPWLFYLALALVGGLASFNQGQMR